MASQDEKMEWIASFMSEKHKTWARAFESLVMMGVEPAERPYAPPGTDGYCGHDPAYNQEVHKALAEKGWLKQLQGAARRELRKPPKVYDNSLKKFRPAAEGDPENDVYVGCVQRVYGKLLPSFLVPAPKGWW